MKLKFTDDICPEGIVIGKLVHVGAPKVKIKKQCDEQVQLTFQVKHLGNTYTAYRKFCADLQPGSELRKFLNTWLSDGINLYRDEESNLDLSALVGLEADLSIKHYQGAKHAKPFASIAAAHLPGTLVKRLAA